MAEEGEVTILIMSVGEYATNYTAKYLLKIGAKNNMVVCLPKEFSGNKKSYESKGIETFIYDEKKYINDDFEFFGFRKRNCGGVGRQGIAEAVEKFGNNKTIFFQLDDDISSICVRKEKEDGSFKSATITKFRNLEKLILAEEKFYQETGIECMSATGATLPVKGTFISNKKIFNNFIMRKGNRLNFDGFKALCSDDYRFNIMNSLLNKTPMISHNRGTISFHQNQGDRDDGNAVLYNGDCSWKKSFALKMMMPAQVEQHIAIESNRVLFRENIMASKLFPPICVSDESGKIVGEFKEEVNNG